MAVTPLIGQADLSEVHASAAPVAESTVGRQSPILIGDLEGLRRKIAGLSGIWLKRWNHFLAQSQREARNIRWYGSGFSQDDVPLHAAFAWLVTGDARWRDIGRRDVMWMVDHYEDTLKVGAQDFDTWIYAAPMARRAMSVDWLWDSGAFDPSEQAMLADFFIRDSIKYPYIVLHHRVPPHANNQGMAMALNLVTVGYLFGVKHGHDARARHLLEVGLRHLTQQIALLPPDGYSGEGSTYIVGVADPLTALACAVMEEISGLNILDLELSPNRNNPGKILALNSQLIPPSSLLPAWDQHGYQLSKAGTSAAYMAHRTGKNEYFAAYRAGENWEFSGRFAWLTDDHVWQWIWMPDPSSFAVEDIGQACYPKSWAETHVAGALINRQLDRHLFQMWDISTPFPVRLHMNPNSILLEAWGSPLTVDGNATDGFPLSEIKETQFLHWAMAKPKTLSWAFGSLGAHSCITVDGEIAHRAKSPGFLNLPVDVATGVLRRLDQREGLQVLAAEVASQYANAYDIDSMIRSSALVDDAFWVVVDQIQARSSHDFTWQLVLRHGAVATPYGARLSTAEHVVMDVFSVDSASMSLVDIKGYPSLLEKRCHHLRKTQTGNRVEFVTVLVPQLARQELADWSQGWEGIWLDADVDHSLDALRGSTLWQSMALADAYYAPDVPAGASPPTLWLRRVCRLPPHIDREDRLLLELPRGFLGECWIDAVQLSVPKLASTHGGDPLLVPPFVELGSLATCTDGDATLYLSIEKPGPLTGHVKLHQAVHVATPQVELVDGNLRVAYNGVHSQVAITEIRTRATPVKPSVPTGEDPDRLATFILQKASGNTTAASGDWEGDAARKGAACATAITTASSAADLHHLVACLEDADWTVRILALKAIGETRSNAALGPLLALLKAENAVKVASADYPPKYRLKEMAIIALHRIGDPRAATALEACMDEAEFYGVRRLAAEALGTLGNVATSIPALQRWTQDSDTETAAAARRSISRLQLR